MAMYPCPFHRFAELKPIVKCRINLSIVRIIITSSLIINASSTSIFISLKYMSHLIKFDEIIAKRTKLMI